MNQPQKPALMRPKPRPQGGSKTAKTFVNAADRDAVDPQPLKTAPVKPSPSKPQKFPKPRKVEPILEHNGLKAGDTIALPYSGQTVTITQFHKTISDTWYVAFAGGCAYREAVTIVEKQEDTSEA